MRRNMNKSTSGIKIQERFLYESRRKKVLVSYREPVDFESIESIMNQRKVQIRELRESISEEETFRNELPEIWAFSKKILENGVENFIRVHEFDYERFYDQESDILYSINDIFSKNKANFKFESFAQKLKHRFTKSESQVTQEAIFDRYKIILDPDYSSKLVHQQESLKSFLNQFSNGENLSPNTSDQDLEQLHKLLACEVTSFRNNSVKERVITDKFTSLYHRHQGKDYFYLLLSVFDFTAKVTELYSLSFRPVDSERSNVQLLTC